MNIRYFPLVVATVLAAGSGACSAQPLQDRPKDEEVRIVPEDLYRYAREQGCTQGTDFYKERPEVREPPYVYGLFSAGLQSTVQDFSAALWCEQPDRQGRKYVLLLKLDGRKWPGGCPARIESQDFAGGLSVIANLEEPLEWFWNMQDRRPVGKPGQMTKGPGIRSLYDGTGNIYYCHEGQWVARPLE